MNFILDTHVFIWWTLTPEKLSSTVINLINNDDNRLLLSIASEIALVGWVEAMKPNINNILKAME